MYADRSVSAQLSLELHTCGSPTTNRWRCRQLMQYLDYTQNPPAIRENALLKVGVHLWASTVRLGVRDVSVAASELSKPYDARLDAVLSSEHSGLTMWVMMTLNVLHLRSVQRFRIGLSRLAEGFDGFRLCVVYVEDRDQLGDLQQIAYVLGQARQLDRAARVLRGRAQLHECAQTARIDVIHLAQIEHDAIVLRYGLPDGIPQ